MVAGRSAGNLLSRYRKIVSITYRTCLLLSLFEIRQRCQKGCSTRRQYQMSRLRRLFSLLSAHSMSHSAFGGILMMVALWRYRLSCERSSMLRYRHQFRSRLAYIVGKMFWLSVCPSQIIVLTLEYIAEGYRFSACPSTGAEKFHVLWQEPAENEKAKTKQKVQQGYLRENRPCGKPTPFCDILKEL